ncbi:hypothetical protein EPUS_04195 [Endocarpon pusillum Z07020]|uniref:Uncharacterized protein n=1 Tax=Endocarpon pusillum (strain Z07020 / HMAS-L-300199) TaxID=1263415 RepID=U1GFC0_ENDPU|nr:uncharacterized protein EPUS_04195 [Endocarpon pusillum Z07020]ERF76337.1 hypothetical protein EPUS_04195 [Endocarpon pusillum Z07020]
MEIAERLKTVLRKSQDLLNIRNAQRAVTSPPSYDAVLLQKHCERLLQPTGTPLHGVAGYLREFDPLIIPPTPEASEKAVQKHLTALSRVNDASTLEYARRSCGGTRRKAYDRHFAHLLTVYEWSWLHQIVYGWEGTSPEIHRLAYETFYSFIALPLRRLKVPLSAFLWHARVSRSISRLSQGSSLSERSPEFLFSTLEDMSSYSETDRLEELLRMNDMILDSVVDNLHLHPKMFKACKKAIAAELRTSIPSGFRSNKFHYLMTDHSAWRRFEKISRDRTSDFEPLRPRTEMHGDANDCTRIASGPRVERLLPDSLAIRQELEDNPWS